MGGCPTEWVFDAYLPEAVSDEALRLAAAHGFGIPANRVCIEADVEPTGRRCDVLVTRVTVSAPEDDVFPHTVRVFARTRGIDKVVLAREISSALGMAMVADAAPPELEDDWMLVLPNGNYRLVTINDDESFALSPYDLAEIARTRVPAPEAA